jgi:hypothetical protein
MSNEFFFNQDNLFQSFIRFPDCFHLAYFYQDLICAYPSIS